MSSTDERFSRRAGILKRVLEWVNQDRFQDHGSWMLLGNKVLATVTGVTGGEREELWELNKPELEPGYQTLGDLQVHSGKLLDARRASLERQPPRSVVRGEDLADLVLGPDWRAMGEPSPTQGAEDLDALYSSELVGKLDRIVERATSLHPHKADASQIRDPGTRAYFQEAHRCYLYGFNAACAVMCRAILESALKAKVDPNGSIEWELRKTKLEAKGKMETRSPGKEESLFLALIEKSGLEPSLKDGAKQVKRCGDFAIHNYERFQREYQSQGLVEEYLAVTRDVLANLYPQPTDP
jgi:hypothetical protein